MGAIIYNRLWRCAVVFRWLWAWSCGKSSKHGNNLMVPLK